jgi:hypothetical protein
MTQINQAHNFEHGARATFHGKNGGHSIESCGPGGTHYHHVGRGCGEAHVLFPDTCNCHNPEPYPPVHILVRTNEEGGPRLHAERLATLEFTLDRVFGEHQWDSKCHWLHLLITLPGEQWMREGVKTLDGLEPLGILQSWEEVKDAGGNYPRRGDRRSV